MWKEFSEEGFLRYPIFMETVVQILPMYAFRIFGGLLYLSGIILLFINVFKTMSGGTFVRMEEDQAPVMVKPLVREKGHRGLESRPVQFTLIALIVILIGGIVQFVPMFMIKTNIPVIEAVQPYTPLELHGRDIYVREGCYNCHSQMVRPFRSEVERYGDYSKAGETVYDHPFQFGSKRTGPDLARSGVMGSLSYKPSSWHLTHFEDPQKLIPQSIMPPYPWLLKRDLDTTTTAKKIRVMQRLGVPYAPGFDLLANENLAMQAANIAAELRLGGFDIEDNKEVIALIAYMHRLGFDIHRPADVLSAK
jgi:cytochrome c oxidase cbb3-type subunit I/II